MNVYSTTNKSDGGSVLEIAGGVGAPQELAHGLRPSGLAVDDSAVYWSDQSSGTVAFVPTGGGPGASLATAQTRPAAIAVDSSYVYWLNLSGSILRRRKM